MKRARTSPKSPVKQARISSFFASPSSNHASHVEAYSTATHAAALTGKGRLQQELEDEELARRLQNEWEGESAVSSSPNALPAAKAVDQTVSKERPEEHKPNVSTPTYPLFGNSIDSDASTADLEKLDASIARINLAVDIFQFDPHAIDTNHWPCKQHTEGEPSARTTPYALLAHAFTLLSATRSRLAIVTILTNLLRILMTYESEALLPAIYLVSNHIAPPYDGVELGLGGAIVNKAIKDVTGKSPAMLRTLWNKTGDPGDVAFEAKKDVKMLMGNRKPIEVIKFFSTLHQIASISGSGSSTAKLSHVTKLLVACRGEETRFLVRTLHSHLRINAVRTTITSAIARAFSLDGPGNDKNLMVTIEERTGLLANPTKTKDRNDPKRLRLIDKLIRCERLVREVRARHPNFSSIVPALLDSGLEKLSERVPLRVGTPLSPMLGSITRSLPAMHTKLGSRAFVSEFKYDGQRVQMHAMHLPRHHPQYVETKKVLQGGKGRWVGPEGDIYVRLFSRHLEDMTDKYPDINNMIPLLMRAKEDSNEEGTNQIEDVVSSFILDAEVVALSLEGNLLPFQTLANRSRKDVELNQVKVRVGVFAFDLMQLNGKSLLKTAFRKRRSLLHRMLPPLEPEDARIARFNHVKSLESNQVDEVEEFFNQARASKCEGIMVKSLDHHWQQPNSTGSARDDVNEGADTIQLLDEEMNDAIGSAIDKSLLDEEITEIDAGEKQEGKGVNGRGKALLSTYEPDKRCESWLKVKKDYVDGIGDSLDLVPIGAWHGMGRKAAWWSPVLLALYDSETGEYQAVCKCISGFTDAEYKSIKFERFVENSETCYNARSEACREHFDTGGLLPDVWFEPREVWEIRGADITLSPVYTAAKGLISEERGLSLRFPRFLRRRVDKNPEDATRPAQLAELYRQQNADIPLEANQRYDEEDQEEVRGDEIDDHFVERKEDHTSIL